MHIDRDLGLVSLGSFHTNHVKRNAIGHLDVSKHFICKLQIVTKLCATPTCTKVKKMILTIAIGSTAAKHINVCNLKTRRSFKLININA